MAIGVGIAMTGEASILLPSVPIAQDRQKTVLENCRVGRVVFQGTTQGFSIR